MCFLKKRFVVNRCQSNTKRIKNVRANAAHDTRTHATELQLNYYYIVIIIENKGERIYSKIISQAD